MKVYKCTDKNMRCKGLQYEIGKAVTVDGDVLKAQIEYEKERSIPKDTDHATGTRGAASATGDQGAASATGYRGAASATGDQGAASATGIHGAASVTGDQSAASATGLRGAASATGEACVAISAGVRGKVMGSLGNAIVCVERGNWDGSTYPIKAILSAVVDGEIIKADVWYTVEGGKWVEA